MRNVIRLLIIATLFTGCNQLLNDEPSIGEAAEQGNIKAVQMHLDAGVDVDTKGERTWMEATPLHHAAKGGHLDIATLLIENGANVNATGSTSPSGKQLTPLDIAIENTSADSDAIQALLRQHDAKTYEELQATK